MFRETFLKRLALAHCYADAAQELLNACGCAEFAYTLDGARKQYDSKDPWRGSFWWMSGHYDRAAAAVRAGDLLSRAAAVLLEELEREARRMGEDTCRTES